MLKDRKMVLWPFCLSLQVMLLKKCSQTFALLLFFPSPNIYTKFWVSLWHSDTCEKLILISFMSHQALLSEALFLSLIIAPCDFRTFEVPLAFLLFTKSCKQANWHKTHEGMRINLGFGIDSLLLPKTGMHVVPSLANLAIYPLAKDCIKGGAPHFTWFNKDKWPRTNLATKSGVSGNLWCVRIEKQE